MQENPFKKDLDAGKTVISVVQWAIVAFDVFSCIMGTHVNTRIAYIVAGIIMTPIFAKFIKSKKAEWNSKNILLSQILISIISLILFTCIFAPLDHKEKPTIPEPTQQQIIAEETTIEATEQATEPTTETESETIPETTEAETEATTEPETEEPTTEQVTESEIIPIELDSLQNLFVSLKNDTTREEIDRYITNNGLVKSAFTGNGAYYIGYENRAVLQRERDRIGDAIDINFFTSGNTDLIGKVKSAKYKLHDSAYISRYTLTFQDGCFCLETSSEEKIYENGEEAMQEYLTLTNDEKRKIKTPA